MWKSEPRNARIPVWALPISLAATLGIDVSFSNRCFFLFLSLLRCFSSGGSPSYVMDWRMSTWSLSMWVSPFRNLRIKGYLLLPEAYRSLSRLSSALSARASTPRSLKLNQTSRSAGTGFDSRRIALRPLVHGFYLIHSNSNVSCSRMS